MKFSNVVISAYYDAHVQGKLNGFVSGNPRVEKAWQTILTHSPSAPMHILEIGCGIGDISWRMLTLEPSVKVTGIDISPISVALAKKLFKASNLFFIEGTIDDIPLSEKFDLVVLVDVYEHIAEQSRAHFHKLVDAHLAPNGRVILTYPTPAHQGWLRENAPDLIQPIDEDITPEVLIAMAKETNTKLVQLQTVGVWHEGDYAHAVLERLSAWAHHPTPSATSSTISRLHQVLFNKTAGPYFPPLKAREKLVAENLGDTTDIVKLIENMLTQQAL